MMRLNETQPREKSSWQVAPVPDFRSMKDLNLFQLSALKNTDYITADLRCIPGPLKHRKNMCADVVARQSSLARCTFAWKLENAQISRIRRNIHVLQSRFSED